MREIFATMPQVGKMNTQLCQPHSLDEFAGALLDAVSRYHGSGTFDDDLTLLMLRRSS
jgi:serine phosphatase RsbU (regulator of sigma subunit)